LKKFFNYKLSIQLKRPGNFSLSYPVFYCFYSDFARFKPVFWLFTKLPDSQDLFHSFNINEIREKIYEVFTKFFAEMGVFWLILAHFFAI